MTEIVLAIFLVLAVCPTLGVVRMQSGPAGQKAHSERLKIERARQKTSSENIRTLEIAELRSRFKTRLL
ncbi:MAG: hypothetical protein KJN60_03730 [Boseongicola sp.]|nr:hypothetical protein [Boseongicola sp.]